MKTILSRIVAICLAAMAAYGSQSPSLMVQQADAQRYTTQPSNPETTPQVEMKFRLVRMSDGFTKNGFRFGGLTYETANQIIVYVYMVHLGSREGAKKEYDDRLKEAVKIIEEGKVQERPASKCATTEDRAVVVLPSTAKDCKEMFTILATAGTALRIQQSCSLETVVALEEFAKRNQSDGDRKVVS
jgi:hypothetical protein